MLSIVTQCIVLSLDCSVLYSSQIQVIVPTILTFLCPFINVSSTIVFTTVPTVTSFVMRMFMSISSTIRMMPSEKKKIIFNYFANWSNLPSAIQKINYLFKWFVCMICFYSIIILSDIFKLFNLLKLHNCYVERLQDYLFTMFCVYHLNSNKKHVQSIKFTQYIA